MDKLADILLTVFKNVRRLKSKAWNNKIPNWLLVCEIYGCGSKHAYEICKRLKIKPQDFKIRK